MFDPESAMVYHNMRFWRQVFIRSPLLAQRLKDMLDQSVSPKHELFGPCTIFQRDLAWLECRFSPAEDAISNYNNECILLTEPDKNKFNHFIRELIRRHFYQQLEEKHAKWHGVADADLNATTKLLRSLEPSSPYRNPIIRLLSDAHATPHRLYKMRVKITPHCQYCLCEEGTIQHIVWDCPRFAALRQAWPPELCNRTDWPSCAKHAMICCIHFPVELRKSWHKLQLFVSQLLWQWMEMNRDPESYCQFAPGEPISNHICVNRLVRPSRQTSQSCQMLYRCNGTRLTSSLNGTNGVALLKTLLCYFLSGQNGHKNAVTQLPEYSLGRMRLHFLCSRVGLAPISCNSVSLWVWLLTSCEF